MFFNFEFEFVYTGQFLFCCRQLNLYEAHLHGTMLHLGQAWPGQARPGLAWPSQAWPGLATCGQAMPGLAWTAQRGSDQRYQAISLYGEKDASRREL